MPGVFLTEILQDVMRDFANPHRMQQSVFILGGAEFLFVCFRFQLFELRANVVVIDFKLEHLFITNGVGDDVRV